MRDLLRGGGQDVLRAGFQGRRLDISYPTLPGSNVAASEDAFTKLAAAGATLGR